MSRISEERPTSQAVIFRLPESVRRALNRILAAVLLILVPAYMYSWVTGYPYDSLKPLALFAHLAILTYWVTGFSLRTRLVFTDESIAYNNGFFIRRVPWQRVNRMEVVQAGDYHLWKVALYCPTQEGHEARIALPGGSFHQDKPLVDQYRQVSQRMNIPFSE